MHNISDMLLRFNEYYDRLKWPLYSSLNEPIEYSLASGGKRIRPLLCLQAHSLFDHNINQSFPIAAAIEYFHNFSLIHDDIMDNAPMRRGKLSTFGKYGQDKAILSGDATLILCYKLIERIEKQDVKFKVLSVFSDMALSICEGQQMDMDFEEKSIVHEDEYIRMIQGKTADLLSFSLFAGGLNAGANDEELDILKEIGRLGGIGFQLQDDFLDYFSNHPKLGKQQFGDVIQKKKSIVYIYITRNLDPKELTKFETIYNGDDVEARLKLTHRYVKDLEIKDKITDAIKKYQDLLFGLLNSAKFISPESDLRNSLEKLFNRAY